MFWNIVILAGIFWIIMSFFSYLQSVHLRNIYKILEPSGKVYYGRDAGFLRTRFTTFAAINKDGKIVDARVLKSMRIINISNVMNLEQIVGKNIKTLQTDLLNLDKNLILAINNLIINYNKKSSK